MALWFDEEVHRAIILPAQDNLSHLCQVISGFISELDGADNQLSILKHDINLRVMNRISYFITNKHFSLPRVLKIVRLPGYACYFLTSDYFRNNDLLRVMSKVMGETIIAVYNNNLDKKISYLYKGLVERVEISEQNKVLLFAQKANISKIIGKEQRRIKMVAAICSCEIKIIAIEDLL